MKSTFAPVAAALLLASNVLAQTTLTVNTPGPAVLCQPLQITWTGGTPPYFLSIVPGGQPSAPAILDFGQQTGTSFRWVVNITAGTSLGLDLRDNTGTLAQSAPFNVQPSSDSSCLTSSGSSSTGTTSTGATTSTTNTPTPPATSPTSPGTSIPATTPTAPITTAPGSSVATTPAPGTSSTGTSSAATTSTASSATGNMANAGLAGAFGIGAALIALVF